MVMYRDLAKYDPFKISAVCTKNEGSEGKELVSPIPSDDHGFGPETPSMQPSVPGLKRVQDNICSGDKSDWFSLNVNKRIKSLDGLNFERKNLEEEFEMTSKFEWLHPSQIKDANGRKPGDPLYDKQTLYIPPDALRKMSASQKQYWDVKCKYMDIVLFFKVVSSTFSLVYSSFKLLCVINLLEKSDSSFLRNCMLVHSFSFYCNMFFLY